MTRRDHQVALIAAAIVAAIEIPVARAYPTEPPTSTPTRMLIAGAMTYAAVLAASASRRHRTS